MKSRKLIFGLFLVTQILIAVCLYYFFQNKNSVGLIISATTAMLFSNVFIFINYKKIKGYQTSLVNIYHKSENLSEKFAHFKKESGEICSTAAAQQETLSSTISAVDQITAMIQKTAEITKAGEQTANQSQKKGEEGLETAMTLASAIEEINSAFNSVSGQIKKYNEETHKIIATIKEIKNQTQIINDITFQTKLLSFNASVEAARAGEAGKGFSVVAEEVSKLAQSSGKAAQEISTNLEKSTKEIEETVTNMTKEIEQNMSSSTAKIQQGILQASQCGIVIDDLIQNMQTLSKSLVEISQATQEQNTGIQHVSKSINTFDKTVNIQISASTKITEEQGSMYDSLESLKDVVRRIA